MSKKGELTRSKSLQRDTWHILEKLKELLQYTESESITYTDYCRVIPPDYENKISPEAEQLLLKQLEKTGVIKIHAREMEPEDYNYLKPTGLSRAIMTRPIPLFDSLFVFKKKFDEVYEEHQKNNIKTKNDSELLFYLTQTGKLYRTLHDGTEQVYQMENRKNKHKIIETLCEEKEPITADDLASRIKSNSRTVRKEIGVLRKEIEDHFEGIIGKDFIPDAHRGGVGYRIGPHIRIKMKY